MMRLESRTPSWFNALGGATPDRPAIVMQLSASAKGMVATDGSTETAVAAKPLEVHDAVTRQIMARVGNHLQALADGGPLHADLAEELRFMCWSAAR